MQQRRSEWKPLYIKEIFQAEGYSIPNYQRDYAWKDKNFRDLWEDLEEAIEYNKKGQGHFIGTMVVTKNEDNKKLYDIIDGQQRTTTIFMLLHVLANEQNEKDKQETRKYLYQKGELKLEVAPQNQSFFKALLEAAEKGNISHCEKDADTEGKQNLFEVLKAILDKVSKLNEEEVNERLEVLLEMVLMRLEEPDPGRAIRTFQSVNDRGVPLLLLDKLKSLLIYYSNTFCDGKMGLDQFINDHFGEIFKIFAKIKKKKKQPHLQRWRLKVWWRRYIPPPRRESKIWWDRIFGTLRSKHRKHLRETQRWTQKS